MFEAYGIYERLLGCVRYFSGSTSWILLLISPRLWILIVECQSGLKVRIKTDIFQVLSENIEVIDLICFVFTLLV